MLQDSSVLYHMLQGSSGLCHMLQGSSVLCHTLQDSSILCHMLQDSSILCHMCRIVPFCATCCRIDLFCAICYAVTVSCTVYSGILAFSACVTGQRLSLQYLIITLVLGKYSSFVCKTVATNNPYSLKSSLVWISKPVCAVLFHVCTYTRRNKISIWKTSTAFKRTVCVAL